METTPTLVQRVVQWVIQNQESGFAFLVYGAQALLKWIIYDDKEKLAEAIEDVGAEMSFLGFSLLVAAIIKPRSLFNRMYSAPAIPIITYVIVFTLLCAFAIFLSKKYKDPHITSERLKLFYLWLAYLIGYHCLKESMVLI